MSYQIPFCCTPDVQQMCRCQNLVARPLERVGYWNCWKIRMSMTLKFAMVVPCVFFFQTYSPSKQVPSHGRTAGAPLIASLLEIFVKELRIEDLVPMGWQCGAQHAPTHHDINGLFCSVSLTWSGSRFLGSLDHHSRPVWFLDTGGPTKSQSLQQNLTPNSFFPV